MFKLQEMCVADNPDNADNLDNADNPDNVLRFNVMLMFELVSRDVCS